MWLRWFSKLTHRIVGNTEPMCSLWKIRDEIVLGKICTLSRGIPLLPVRDRQVLGSCQTREVPCRWAAIFGSEIQRTDMPVLPCRRRSQDSGGYLADAGVPEQSASTPHIKVGCGSWTGPILFRTESDSLWITKIPSASEALSPCGYVLMTHGLGASL